MYDDYAELQELKETADILAGMDHWTNLYDEEQLAKNKVPMYSITYVDDMYVDFDFARKTASKIRNCKQFITNAVYHNGYVHSFSTFVIATRSCFPSPHHVTSESCAKETYRAQRARVLTTIFTRLTRRSDEVVKQLFSLRDDVLD